MANFGHSTALGGTVTVTPSCISQEQLSGNSLSVSNTEWQELISEEESMVMRNKSDNKQSRHDCSCKS